MLNLFHLKTKEYKGNLQLENSQFKTISESDSFFEKLHKMKPPKPPADVKEITQSFYFSICPKGSPKTYYFAVDVADKDYWIELLTSASNGPEQLKKVGDRDSLPTLILHHDIPLTNTKVDFSNEVTYRQYEDDKDSAPENEQFSIKFSDSCSTKLNHEKINSETGRYYHNGSMSSGSSTISYRSSFSMTNSLASDITHNESQDTNAKIQERSDSTTSKKQTNDENKQNIKDNEKWKSCVVSPNIEIRNYISHHRTLIKEKNKGETEDKVDLSPVQAHSIETTFGDIIEDPKLDNIFQNSDVKEFCFD